MRKKIKDSLTAKIFLGITGILFVSCMVMYIIVMFYMPQTYESSMNKKMMADYDALASELQTTSIEDATPSLFSFCIENQASLTVTDPSGSILFQLNMEEYDDSDQIDSKDGIALTSNYQYEGGEYILTATAATKSSNQNIVNVFIQILPVIILCMLVISAIGAILYSHFLAKPIVHISGISRRMSALDMTWRCETKRTDEIGTLAASLNEMAENLDNALKELQTANTQLQKDIEKERRQEKQRRTFFAAVSHELKTPITILKGELEGMIYNVGMYKDRDTYLQHAFETTQSMEKLVQEILAVSKMESHDFRLELADTNIADIVRSCCKLYREPAEEKSITIHSSIQKDIFCRADSKQLQKAISNIIGNAVFHSPKGADVFIGLQQDSSSGIFSVGNSGIHIEQEHMEQLFDPFYRADQSRSRYTGGSGLGLYIVKSILKHHGFSYTIENTEKGVRFTVTFPIQEQNQI